MTPTKVFEIWYEVQFSIRRFKYIKMWYWHLKSVSNLGEEVVAHGETNGYFNKKDCEKGVAFVKGSKDAEIKYLN